jgi:SAM-dependent methyltransferase
MSELPGEDADLETSSEGYARRFAGPVGRFFLEVQAHATLSLLSPWPRGSVLDVGGGHGQLTGPLVEAGHEVTIYGSSPACGERVRPWTDTGRARLQFGDLLRTPFSDRAFDVVLSFRLLPHVARWPDLVAELGRVARHAVIVDYPTSRSVNAVAGLFFGMKRGVEGDTRPFTVFRDAEVVRSFARAGLRPTGRRAQFFFPMALHRALGSAAVARGLEGLAAGLRLTPALGSPVILRLEREA